MPETADQKSDKQVDAVPDPPSTTAAKRNINVVPKPGGEGDVPAAPKFFHGKGEVGAPKVRPKFYAKKCGAADGNIRIPGKVAVDLDGVHHRGNDKDQSHITVAVVVHLVDRHGKGIGDHQFLKIAPDHQFQTIGCAVVVEAAFSF